MHMSDPCHTSTILVIASFYLLGIMIYSINQCLVRSHPEVGAASHLQGGLLHKHFTIGVSSYETTKVLQQLCGKKDHDLNAMVIK